MLWFCPLDIRINLILGESLPHCRLNKMFLFLSLMQIQKCELVLIHTYPVGEDSLVSDRPKKEVRSLKWELTPGLGTMSDWK